MEQQKQKCVVTSAESKSTGKRKVTVGSVWDSKNCGKFEVVEQKGCWDVKVRFVETGFCAQTSSQEVKIGAIKDKLKPSVYGIGFIGDGRFKSSLGNKGTRAYNSWKRMFERCYSGRNPTYKDCTVCDDWHNFQNFAEWYEENYPKDGCDYHLDKDLKILGNREYSPDGCMFVSPMVNTFISDASAARGEFMIGVCWHKRSKKLIAQCRDPITGGQKYLGSFLSEIEAHLAWRQRKSDLAIEVIKKQNNKDVKEALIRWKSALDGNLIHTY
ncbi:DNA-binding domain protein [Vibrio phage 1.236.O._10N.261.52.C4]|nr:DNA-binding domain protein [Vibrio phage 1.236.O._10N.261.52.C4]AUS00530.1 DNA-binding domain protein [Vibrio phage 1.276.O._10N.286.54.E4]